MIFTLVRALAYAMTFVGVLLVFLPARILRSAGLAPPPTTGPAQIVGIIMGVLGAAVALWCILAFVVIGKGTQMPLDPPRHLVIRGPYRFVRNPMYIGVGFALAGAAVYFGAVELMAYGALLGLITHAFVVFYEEPALSKTFGKDYDAYRRNVRRWLPRL